MLVEEAPPPGPRSTSRGPRQELLEWETKFGKRRCAACAEVKPLDEFHVEKHGRLGRNYTCKLCVCSVKAKAMKLRRAADPERHREAVRRQQRRPDWNERRRAKCTPESIKAQNSRRMARLSKAPGSFTSDEWLALCDKYANVCLRCWSKGPLEPDHVIPLSWEGSRNDIGNIQPLCRSCNAAKGNRNAEDYRCF